MAQVAKTGIIAANDEAVYVANNDENLAFKTRDNAEITTLEEAQIETRWRASCLSKFLQLGAHKSTVVLPETRGAFWRLNTCYKDWKVVENEWLDDLVDVLCQEEYPATACSYIKALFNKMNETEEGWYKMTRNATFSLLNFSSSSARFQQELGKSGIIQILIQNGEKLKEAALKNETVKTEDLLRSVVALLMNLSRSPELKTTFLNANAVEVMKGFLDYPGRKDKAENQEYIVSAATVCLAHILNDTAEGAKWADERGVMKILLDKLQPCLTKGDVHWRGISLEAMAEGLRLLAMNKTNAIKLVNDNVTSVIGLLLRSDRVPEKICGVNLLWAICFVDELRRLITTEKRDECLAPLQTLKASATDAQLIHDVTRLLEYLSEREEFDKGAVDKDVPKTSESFKYDVFISYSHSQKGYVELLYDELVGTGLKVWFDRDRMSGSLLQSMADGILQSRCVLICFSPSYWASNACRKEAEFGFIRKKTLIPLKMDEQYKPEGWLDMLVSTVLYLSFDEKKYSELARKIKACVTGQTQETAAFFPIPLTKTNSALFENWLPEDVKKWLVENSLWQFSKLMENFTGRHLVMLQKMRQQSPQTYFDAILKHFLEIPLPDKLLLFEALDRLFSQ